MKSVVITWVLFTEVSEPFSSTVQYSSTSVTRRLFKRMITSTKYSLLLILQFCTVMNHFGTVHILGSLFIR